MPVSSSAPRRSLRLVKPLPPPKKQRLGKSRNPKSVDQGMPRRSSRLMDVVKPPPPKKQCLEKSRTSKSVNQGHHDSDPQFGTQSPDNSSIENIALKGLRALGSDYWDSDTEPDLVLGNQSDDEDIFFGYYMDINDGRKVYIVDLTRNCRDESRCKNILKEIGCEAYFVRLSKTFSWKFYARLTEDDAAKLERVTKG